MRKLFYILSSTILFIKYSTVFGAQELIENNKPLPITSKDEFYSINPFAEVFNTIDTLSGEEAWSRILKGQMSVGENTANPGMNVKDHAFWLLFTLENETDQQELYLEIDYPQLDYIQLYTVSSDSVKRLYETGDRFPFGNRPVSFRNFILPIQLLKGESKTFLLNVDKRSSAIRFPLKVYSSELFIPRIASENIYYGVYFGFFVLIFIVSLLIGLVLKRLLFVWYSFYVLFLSLWIFSRLGYSYQYIIPSYPALNTHFYPAITSSAILFLVLYVMSFFETKITIPNFHKLMKGIVIFIISFFFIWAAFPDQFLKLAPALFLIKYGITFLIIVFAYTAAYKYIKTDAFRAKIFIAAYSILFLGIGSVIFGEYGYWNFTFFIDPFMLGFLIEVILLTFLMIRTVIRVLLQKEELAEGTQHLSKLLKKVKDQKKMTVITLNSKAVIDIKDISYIKSDDHYLEFYLNGRDTPEVDREKLSEMLQKLPDNFIQIHRSYVVNIEAIKLKKATKVILKNGDELPVSRTYKDAL